METTTTTRTTITRRKSSRGAKTRTAQLPLSDEVALVDRRRLSERGRKTDRKNVGNGGGEHVCALDKRRNHRGSRASTTPTVGFPVGDLHNEDPDRGRLCHDLRGTRSRDCLWHGRRSFLSVPLSLSFPLSSGR